MFDKKIYQQRRAALVQLMQQAGEGGIAVFLGNSTAAMNYRDNTYEFRQDSCFSYFWGINEEGFAATLNLENGKECIYADDVEIDDIIWMGPQRTVADKAEDVGVEHTAPLKMFDTAVQFAAQNDVPVHFLPSGRNWNRLRMAEITGTSPAAVYEVAPYESGDYIHASEELAREVIRLRLIKKPEEIEQIDLACDCGVQMHTLAMNLCRVGAKERDIVAAMDGFAQTVGWGVSFPTILSQNGQILHGHSHALAITEGRLLVVDAGVSLDNYYCSDHTRTLPCGGKFTSRQREIYDIVADCNILAAQTAAPGVEYRTVHLKVARLMLERLAELGLVHGNVDDMVNEGIAGLFMPHGLGHNMGLDVHDMEDLGENLVGYGPGQERSEQLGLGSLRMARALEQGHVITDEPGIYFVPDLWAYFRREGLDKGFVNFDKLQSYSDFGGIRLENDLLITADGCRELGHKHLPLTSKDVEEAMKG